MFAQIPSEPAKLSQTIIEEAKDLNMSMEIERGAHQR